MGDDFRLHRRVIQFQDKHVTEQDTTVENNKGTQKKREDKHAVRALKQQKKRHRKPHASRHCGSVRSSKQMSYQKHRYYRSRETPSLGEGTSQETWCLLPVFKHIVGDLGIVSHQGYSDTSYLLLPTHSGYIQKAYPKAFPYASSSHFPLQPVIKRIMLYLMSLQGVHSRFAQNYFTKPNP